MFYNRKEISSKWQKKWNIIFLIYLLFFTGKAFAQKDFTDFIPKNYILYEGITGDLNKDGKEDVVIIIKATDKKNIVKNDYDRIVDRNRRGIIVLLKEENGYKKLVENLSCFSSENEDGGVYFPPGLSPEIRKNSLFIHYGHGRYGWWHYQFRILKNDMQLIGYEQNSQRGPLLLENISINFLTKKKSVRKNLTDNEEEEPVFEDTWSDFPVKNPIFLSKIEDFDELDFE